jgi:hypothetical protein
MLDELLHYLMKYLKRPVNHYILPVRRRFQIDLKDVWIKKFIFNGLKANAFHKHFALTIRDVLCPNERSLFFPFIKNNAGAISLRQFHGFDFTV